MEKVSFDDVQSANLHGLYAIRLAVENDAPGACCRFGINMAVAEKLKKMSYAQLVAFVSEIGSTTLFPPRDDLLILLCTPTPLLAPMAAVKPPHPISLPASDSTFHS